MLNNYSIPLEVLIGFVLTKLKGMIELSYYNQCAKGYLVKGLERTIIRPGHFSKHKKDIEPIKELSKEQKIIMQGMS
jgi:hypothetical protein